MSGEGGGGERPRRWLVLGGSGSGKSTLAVEMGRRLGLPVVHIDRLFWRPGWVEPDRASFHERIIAACAEDAWVVDGNYSHSLHLRAPRAQAAVVLDLPWWIALLGIFRRAFSAVPRPDLADGCEERLPDLQFIWWTVGYRRRSLGKVLRRLAEHPTISVHHLRSRREVRAFLASLGDRGRRPATELPPGAPFASN